MSGVMILGGAGMLGHKLVQVLGERFGGVAVTVREPADDPWLAGVPILQGNHVRYGIDALDWDAVARCGPTCWSTAWASSSSGPGPRRPSAASR